MELEFDALKVITLFKVFPEFPDATLISLPPIPNAPLAAGPEASRKLPSEPEMSGRPAAFTVPAVELPWMNLLVKFGSANVVLPSPLP